MWPIRSRSEWIQGLIDSAANGRNQADGQRLVQTYRKLGLDLSAIDNPIGVGNSECVATNALGEA